MKFIVNSTCLEANCSELKDPEAFLDSIRKCKISIEEAPHKQEEFHRCLKKLIIENQSEKQKKKLANINKLFKGRNNAIKFVDDYGSMILEARKKSAEEEPEPGPSKAKTKRKKSPLELCEEFINGIKNDEKNINEQIFKYYFFITLYYF